MLITIYINLKSLFNEVFTYTPLLKIIYYIFTYKNTYLNFCITLHIVVLVICKTICLVPRSLLILLSCCWYFIKSFSERFKMVPSESLKLEEYTKYVVQIEEDAKLSKRILRNTLHSVSQLIEEP